ncbi:MAG: response regulator [Planctomycetota bacterium]|jgi:two-component system alkaline phosphatase synthesis response regulator PhoP
MLGLFKTKEKTDRPKEQTGRVKILVVDDDTALIETIRHRFEYCKWEVINAADGKEGLEKATNEKPDLIVLDINMPVLNGHEMIRRLRGNRKLKEIPVIMCTMSNKVQDITAAASFNISGYVTKPFDFAELIEKISNALKELKEGNSE